ncbi:MAG: hypothetical protein RL481_1094, partial [Pseudomonadota bacterium]
MSATSPARAAERWLGEMTGPPLFTIDEATLKNQTPVVKASVLLIKDNLQYCWSPDYNKLKSPNCLPILTPAELPQIDVSRPAVPGLMNIAEAERTLGVSKTAQSAKGSSYYLQDLAGSAIKAQRYELALSLLNQVLKKYAGNETALFLRAQLYVLAGRDDLALADVDSGISWAAENTKWRQASKDNDLSRRMEPALRILRSHLYSRQRRYDLAEADVNGVEAHLRQATVWGSQPTGFDPYGWRKQSEYLTAVVPAARQAFSAKKSGMSREAIAQVDAFLENDARAFSGCAAPTVITEAAEAKYRWVRVNLVQGMLAARCNDHALAGEYFNRALSVAEAQVPKTGATRENVRELDYVLYRFAQYFADRGITRFATTTFLQRHSVLLRPEGGYDETDQFLAMQDVLNAARKMSAADQQEMTARGLKILTEGQQKAAYDFFFLNRDIRSMRSDAQDGMRDFNNCRRRLNEGNDLFAQVNTALIRSECEDHRAKMIRNLEHHIARSEAMLKNPEA